MHSRAVFRISDACVYIVFNFINVLLRFIGNDGVIIPVNIDSISKVIKQNDNCIGLFIDGNYKLKKLAFDPWYLDLVVNSNGIWIGPGVADQSVIKLNDFNETITILEEEIEGKNYLEKDKLQIEL